MSVLTEEPDNGQFAAWFFNNQPYAIFHRDDRRDQCRDGHRWVNASPYGGDFFDTWTWSALTAAMREAAGPYLMQVVGRG